MRRRTTDCQELPAPMARWSRCLDHDRVFGDYVRHSDIGIRVYGGRLSSVLAFAAQGVDGHFAICPGASLLGGARATACMFAGTRLASALHRGRGAGGIPRTSEDIASRSRRRFAAVLAPAETLRASAPPSTR